MERKMKVLIISSEVWRDDTSGGNVLSNIFRDLPAEFAQIYCFSEEPFNGLCKRYYQMTDGMAMRTFFNKKPIGKTIVYDDYPNIIKCDQQGKAEPLNKKMYSFFQRHRWGIFYAMRDLVWNTSNWKTQELIDFIKDFDPDVIFATCYFNPFILKLTRFVVNLTGKKLITYVYDDVYTLKQFSLSPYFWLKRFWVRRQLRKTAPLYSLVYTMTDAQKDQFERAFQSNVKILLKGESFSFDREKEKINDPIKIVYAGGVYNNRWKTLKALAKAIQKINKDEQRVVLEIYTGDQIYGRISKALNREGASVVKGKVTQRELADIYANSDIALHAESFDLKNRLKVRFSFSTKIVDCLTSGCAVMAICDKNQGGFLYLKKEDAALCIDNRKKIHHELLKLVDNPDMIIEYSRKAQYCCNRNHNKDKISEMLKRDFEKFSQKEN